jgi:hypothetical protein
VLVLGMGMLVSVMVLGTLITNRLQMRNTDRSSDSLHAEALAESALDYALTTLNANNTWRTVYTSGVETAPITVGGGTISFRVVDEVSGNLNSTTTNPVRIYGIGRYSSATRYYSVLAEGKNAMTCLSTALAVGGNFSESHNANFQAAGFTLASNGTFAGNTSGGASTINANVEAVGAITPNQASISGSSTTAVPARVMPVATVFEPYIAMGTPIEFGSISGGILQNVVLSPASNPYGGGVRNSRGIYVIDCGGSKLVITHCRIVGTLVILNPGIGTSIGTGSGSSDDINWAPAVPNYPCLLVRGNITIAWSSSSGDTLKEFDLSAGLYNFNPPGTPYPYPTGFSDFFAFDTYPSTIDGMVYVSGNVTGIKNYPSMDQLIVGGTYDPVQDNVTLSYNGNYAATPPPGFRGGGALIAAPATCRWEKAP